MSRVINISTIGHAIAALSLIGVVIYAFVRLNDLRRTTRYSSKLFYTIVGIGLVFAAINIFFEARELSPHEESALINNIEAVTQFSSIIILSGIILVLFASKIVIRQNRRAGRILAIGAHPDDLEIAAGAAIAKMRDSGYFISGLVMTRGEKGGDGDTRPVEALRGAEFLGLDTVNVLDFPDTKLSDHIVKISSAIDEMIVKVKPDIIFTHSFHDIHQDHRTVYEATMQAALITRTTILCYESPSVTLDFHPTYFIEVDKYVDVKIQALREHWNQRKKPYMKADVVRGKMACRGALANVNYAEGFEVARMVSAI